MCVLLTARALTALIPSIDLADTTSKACSSVEVVNEIERDPSHAMEL